MDGFRSPDLILIMVLNEFSSVTATTVNISFIMKKNRIIFWMATSFIILWEGVMPLSTMLFTPEYVNMGTKPLGYPDYFAYTLIICKVLGVIAIAYPGTPAKLREWAYAGLAFNLIFAVISHACVDRNIGFILMPLFVLGILAVSYVYRGRLSALKPDEGAVGEYRQAFGGNG